MQSLKTFLILYIFLTLLILSEFLERDYQLAK